MRMYIESVINSTEKKKDRRRHKTMAKKIDWSKAVISVDTSAEAKKELEERIAYSKMTKEEKMALADKQQEEYNKSLGLK